METEKPQGVDPEVHKKVEMLLENHPRLVDNRKIKFLMKKKSDSVREVRED